MTKVWTVQYLAKMLEPVQNQTHLIDLLERLCLAVENLNENLRPELKKTATFERRKQEVKEIETAASKAVAKWKDKKRNPISAIKH